MPRSLAVAHRSAVTGPTDRRVGDRLRTDWDRIRCDPGALDRAVTWRVGPDPLRDLDEVLAAIGYDASADPGAGHEVALRRLVATAAVDPLAGRVVLQRLLPALVARARRSPAPTAAALDELVGAAWIAIVSFDQRRRPASLAAALVGDAVHRAFRATTRRRLVIEATARIDVAVDRSAAPAVDTADELDDVFRIGRIGGVAEADLALLRRLLVAERAEDVAAELHVTSRTLRNRRSRITEQLRELAA